jgi:hypothetical protein
MDGRIRVSGREGKAVWESLFVGMEDFVVIQVKYLGIVNELLKYCICIHSFTFNSSDL